MKRYARQIALKSIGEKGQETLLDKTVLIIGAGGTGSAAADLFSRLGIKKIILIDRDKVEISNLHRQILYDNNDVGKYKVDAAEEKIRSINPDIEIETFNMTFDSSKAEMVKKANIIFDGTDNMTTRFIINDACDKYNKPWIFTSASEIYGEFKAIIPGITSCYACYNKEPVETPDCSVTGVLNSLPSMVSSYAVNLAIKILLDKDVNGDLFYINGFDFDFREIKINKNNECRCCKMHDYKYLGDYYSHLGRSILL